MVRIGDLKKKIFTRGKNYHVRSLLYSADLWNKPQKNTLHWQRCRQNIRFYRSMTTALLIWNKPGMYIFNNFIGIIYFLRFCIKRIYTQKINVIKYLCLCVYIFSVWIKILIGITISFELKFNFDYIVKSSVVSKLLARLITHI